MTPTEIITLTLIVEAVIVFVFWVDEIWNHC